MKAPPHRFIPPTDGEPAMWVFAGGHRIVQEAGSTVIACERCDAASEPIEDVRELRAFLIAHGGSTCNTAAKKARRSA